MILHRVNNKRNGNFSLKYIFFAFLNINWSIFSSPVWAIAITWRPSFVCNLFQKSSPLPNLTWIILRWFPFKIVSDSPALHSRWPLLLKIEISSNGQNCSILSQNVPKFDLYKHNDELFNMYYRIFYELWTFADFDRLCKLEKRGDEI